LDKKTKKIALVSVKLVIAAGLLTWVISQVHFRDFVQTRQGQSYSLLQQEVRPDGQRVFRVDAGGWWRREIRLIPAEQVEPVGDRIYVRPGFFTNLRSVSVSWLVLGVSGFLLAVFFTAMRWRALLGVQEVRIGAWEALRLTVLGEFFNNLVPGTVGGDLVKAYYAIGHTHLRSGVLVSVVLDRLLGLAMLALLSVVMVLTLLVLEMESLSRIYLSLIASLICLGMIGLTLVLVLSRRLRARLHLQRLLQRLPLSRHLEEAGLAARTYRTHWKEIFSAAGITFLAHVSWISGVWLVSRSVGLEIPYYMYVVYVPLIYILGAVPITPGGVGLVEKLYVAFLPANPAGVLALALLVRLIKMAVSLPGLLVTITGARIPDRRQIESRLGLQSPASPDPDPQ
jgi:hypothetical protein